MGDMAHLIQVDGPPSGLSLSQYLGPLGAKDAGNVVLFVAAQVLSPGKLVVTVWKYEGLSINY